MTTLEPNGEIGGYRVESVVRSGTGGAVYQAEQTSLRRTVALYVPATSASSSASATRFADDARLLAGLDHPNLVPVYEVDLAGDHPYATVRDIGGRRLEDVLRDGPLDPERAVAIGEQVAAALESLEVVDVAPANLTKSVIVVDDHGTDHAYVSPLEAIVDAGPDAPVLYRTEHATHPSTVALADLLTLMVTGSEGAAASRVRLPVSLRGAIDRSRAADDPPAPSELMRAARDAVGPTPVPRRRSKRVRVLVAGVLVLVAVVVGAAVLMLRDDSPSGDANAPVASVAATIPLQAAPGSFAVTDDAVWVATGEGTVLRVDPTRDEVVGTPIRFMPARADENVTIRAGEGSIWVLDGSGGNLTRIDPAEARITGRLHLGGILHGATVAGGAVWISRSPPNSGVRQRGELIRVEADSFRRSGRPIPIGPLALDVEVADGVAWTMNVGNGTITRVDLRTGATRTVKPSSQPVDAALRDGALWIPDPVDGTVTVLDTRRLVAPSRVIRADHPFSVVATTDSVWVLADTGYASGAARLYRIDPHTNALLGRPLELGPGYGWLTTGPDVVWARSFATHALQRLLPTTPAPAPAAVPAAGQPDTLVSGPLGLGTWRARDFAVPFSVTLDERGWISHAPAREAVELSRFTEPHTSLGLYAPRQYFTATGGVRPLDDLDEFAAALASNPHLRVIARERVRIDGAPAARLTVAVRPYEGYPDLCARPCVALLPLAEGLTVALESSVHQRLTVAAVAGKPVVVLETAPLSRKGFAETERLMRTLRLGRSGG